MLQMRHSRLSATSASVKRPRHLSTPLKNNRLSQVASVGRPSIDPSIRAYVAGSMPGTVYSVSTVHGYGCFG